MTKPGRRSDPSEQFTGPLAEPIEMPGIPIAGDLSAEEIASQRVAFRLTRQFEKLPMLANHFGFERLSSATLLPLLLRLAEELVPGFRTFTPPHERRSVVLPRSRGGKERRTKQEIERYATLVRALKPSVGSDQATIELILSAEHAARKRLHTIDKIPRADRPAIKKRAKTLANVIGGKRASIARKRRAH